MRKRKYIDLIDILINLNEVTGCIRYTTSFLSDLCLLLEATGLYEDVNSISKDRLQSTIYIDNLKVGRYCEHHPIILSDIRRFDRSIYIENGHKENILVFYGNIDCEDNSFPDIRDNDEKVDNRLDSDLQSLIYLLVKDSVNSNYNISTVLGLNSDN